MKLIEEITKEILTLKMGECTTFKINDTRFLFVECWNVGDGDDFVSLELNSGKETTDKEGNIVYELDEILECGTYDFGNAEDISCGVDYMIGCC